MKKNYLYFTLLAIFINILPLNGQVGIQTEIIEDGVTLQLEASDKGVLFPRIALTSRTSTSPLDASIPTGTMVFNTATAGNFPNTITPGLHWWSAEDQQWTNLNTNINNVLVKYTNSESSTNYNTNTWQNVKLFGNRIINESSSIYEVDTANHTIKINSPGLYSISTLLSFDRLNGGNRGRLSISARLYINGNPVGTEQVISPGYTSLVSSNRGLFSHSFTEYLELNDGDVLSVMVRRTVGTFSGSYGSAEVRFLQSGDSSIAILRIR